MINLLSPLLKQAVYGDLLFRQLKRLVLIGAVIFAAGAVLILNSLIFLKIQSRELGRALSLENSNTQTREVQELEQEAKDFNALLARYGAFKSAQADAADVLLELDGLVPSGVNLQVLSFDSTNRRMIISGTAASRADVVLFEDRLKQSAVFEKLESPLSNFLESANANFSFTFYVK